MTKTFFPTVFCIAAVLTAGCAENPEKASRPIVLATTTSTADTGLLDELIPAFERQNSVIVKTVAVGTDEALEMGRRGEADVLLVHAPETEKEFVDQGKGKNRRLVMHNDFVIVGPKSDPAGIKGGKDAVLALKTIAEGKYPWISRGDRSGTHQKEKALWKAAGIEPTGDWFVETGQGMGATLRIASERESYTLADRGTFISVSSLELEILVEGDGLLSNPYHVIEVVNDKVNAAGQKLLADFFCLPATQRMIGEFTYRGRQLFIPDAIGN